jgi:hypothetical protein
MLTEKFILVLEVASTYIIPVPGIDRAGGVSELRVRCFVDKAVNAGGL